MLIDISVTLRLHSGDVFVMGKSRANVIYFTKQWFQWKHISNKLRQTKRRMTI